MLDFDFIRDNWLFIASGVGVTLGVTIFSFLLAVPIAVVVARGRQSTFLPIKVLFSLYALLIEGIPLYLQALFVFLALPQLGVDLPGARAAILLLTINYSSHLSEDSYRLFPTQRKTHDKTLFSLIPLFANVFNNMIRDSATLQAGHFIRDAIWRATSLGRAEFKNLEALTIAAITYLILITGITLGAKLFKLKTTASKFGNEGAV